MCIFTDLSSGNVSAVARLPDCTVALFKGCWGTYSGPFEINQFYILLFHFVWLMGVCFLRINERPRVHLVLCTDAPELKSLCLVEMDEAPLKLRKASKHGHGAAVQSLLEHHASTDGFVNVTDEGGRTSLSWASGNGHLDVAQLLLAQGAAVNQANNKGLTPLIMASENGHLDVAQLLLAQSAAVNQANNDGATPLYWALQEGHLGVVDVLRAHGAKK